MTSGSCACGEIAYQYGVEPAVTALCHCTVCQKWSGSGNSVNVGVPTAEFKVTKGAAKKYTSKANSGADHHRYFCSNCGSSVYSEMDGMAGTTFIKAGTLDNGANDIPVKIEFFTSKRCGYASPVDGAQQLQTMS